VGGLEEAILIKDLHYNITFAKAVIQLADADGDLSALVPTNPLMLSSKLALSMG
jgi:hypothetical protein